MVKGVSQATLAGAIDEPLVPQTPEYLFALGLQLLNSQRTESKKLAFNCFLEGLKADYLPSIYMVGFCYERGISGTKDLSMALRIYQKAAYLNWLAIASQMGFSAEPLNSSANPLENSLSEVERESFFQKMVALPDENSIKSLLLGFCFEKGLGVKIHLGFAFKYYQLAVTRNVVGASCLAENIKTQIFNLERIEHIQDIYALFVTKWSLSFKDPLLKQSFDLREQDTTEAKRIFMQYREENPSTRDAFQPFTEIKCLVTQQERGCLKKWFLKPLFHLVDAITKEILNGEQNTLAFSTGELTSERSFCALLQQENTNPFNGQKALQEGAPFFVIGSETFQEMHSAISFFYENLI